MNDLYGDKKCLDFSKEELETYLAQTIKDLYGIDLLYSYSDDNKVSEIKFKGISEDELTINLFNDGMVGFFVQNEIVMFIDDNMKNTVRGVEGCIIYEGTLRDKDHSQILRLFLELFDIVYGTKSLKYKEKLISEKNYYCIKKYFVNLRNNRHKKATINFENISFKISKP